MTQANPIIGANQTGLDYRNQDNAGKTALLTHNKGAVEPDYAQAGTIWVDDNAAMWLLKFYDGDEWSTLFQIDPANHAVTPYSGVSAGRIIGYAADAGVANAYVIDPLPKVAAYAAGQIVTFVAVNTNTDASTLVLGELPAQAIKTLDGAALLPGAIKAGGMHIAIYDGTSFILINPNFLATNNRWSGKNIFEGNIGRSLTADVSRIASGQDLNTYVESGFYYISNAASSGISNVPFTGPQTLEVHKLSADDVIQVVQSSWDSTEIKSARRRKNASGWGAWVQSSAATSGPSETVFSSSGTYATPAGAKYLEVECVGGGGGGGYSNSAGSFTYGGGGSGGYVKFGIAAPSGTYTVTVGAGGSVTHGARGAGGGASSFGSIGGAGGGGGGGFGSGTGTTSSGGGGGGSTPVAGTGGTATSLGGAGGGVGAGAGGGASLSGLHGSGSSGGEGRDAAPPRGGAGHGGLVNNTNTGSGGNGGGGTAGFAGSSGYVRVVAFF